MVLVDTNVLIDVFQDDADWADWSTTQLRAQSQVGELVIDPVVYSELSLAFESPQALDAALERIGVRMEETPRAALFLAARAWLAYRRSGGARRGVLPDFFIGAHAAVSGCPLLTRDGARYRRYFPTLRLIQPEA